MSNWSIALQVFCLCGSMILWWLTYRSLRRTSEMRTLDKTSKRNSHGSEDIAKLIAMHLHRDMRAARLLRLDFDCIKCGVGCWLASSGAVASREQRESLDELTLRKLVEMCA